jgi:phosphoribosylformylglycinamidine synthase
MIALIGPIDAELGGSEYQRLAHGVNQGPRPKLDLDLEERVQAAVRRAISAGLLHSAHDCAEGGLAVALAECCIAGAVGCSVALDESAMAPLTVRPAGTAGILFGETQSRFVISFPEEVAMSLRALVADAGVPMVELGRVGGDRIRISEVIDVAMTDAASAYESALA